MKFSKYQLFQNAIYVAFFILFSGYFAGIIIWTNLGLGESRLITIPLRLIVLVILFLAFLLRSKIQFTTSIQLFLLFSTLYFLRIFYEILTGGNHFHLSETQFLLYYSAFVFFPFLLISQLEFDKTSYDKIFHAIIFSTLILSLTTIIYYGSLIGSVARISQVITREDNYISPLALSYTGALGIGIGTTFILTNRKIEKSKKILIFSAIILSVIPFFLGASRGSIFALSLPFIFMIFQIRSIKLKFFVTFIGVLLGTMIVIYSEKFGSGLISRFINIQADIESGKSSAVRISMWIDSLNQFSINPFWGNSLENESFNSYPHNVFLEVLLTTGLIGIIPFTYLIFRSLKISKKIFELSPQYSWIAVLFLQSLIQSMFSGGLYSSSWLFCSLILLLNLKNQVGLEINNP